MAEWIENSKKSICKDCANNLGFNGMYYKCLIAFNVQVIYKRDVGLFHTEIIGCDKFKKKEEDSKVLKAIKKVAKEESEYYDKHGYYSFWSDALKAQRIKEQEEKDEKG